jgi:hypothetical protein
VSTGGVAGSPQDGYKEGVIRHAFYALISVVLSFAACRGTHPEEPALMEAVRRTVDAVRTKDMAALWEMTDRATQTSLLAIVRDAELARQKVSLVWPESQRGAALEALASGLLDKLGPDDAGRGPRLLSAVLDPSTITVTTEALDGLSPRDITHEAGPPPRASVFTSGGDVFTFTREGDTWRSALVRDQVLEKGPFTALHDNAKKTLGLAEEREKAWRVSLDPKTPQGSYNLARQAQGRKPPDLEALFALLDDSARGALFEALETARMAQKAIQQRLAKPLRKEAYANANLTRLVEATSDRDLFRRWGQSDDFVLPLSFLDEPRSLEGPADGIDVKVVTESGGKVPMHRDEDGFWRVGGFRPAVEKVLIEPAKRALQPSP